MEIFAKLIEKTEKNGGVVKIVLGDAAYSAKDNLSYAKKKQIQLVPNLNPSVSKDGPKDSDGFAFNKDADKMVCPTGELAVRKARQGKKNQNANQVMTYYFDVDKCKKCPMRQGCYTKGAKSKTYSISIKSDLHQEQINFENTEEF